MDNNGFFGAVLRGLGFTVHSSGARVGHSEDAMSGGGYLSWYVA